MTAPLAQLSTSALAIGRKLRDCDDGEILVVVSVDPDGDYVVADEHGGVFDGVVPRRDVHGAGETHRPPRLFVDGLQRICFTWIAPPT